MTLHRWGRIDYLEAREKMGLVHAQAVKDKKNHLIFCEHPAVFTVGKNEDRAWPLPVVETDRGGSITCHSEGQLLCYFCFQVKEPMLFYRRVRQSFERVLNPLLPDLFYDPKQAGFYLENRKIASLGFRYANGVSLHGVSVNVDVDLDLHNRVNPCGLEGISATSLKAEGVSMEMAALEALLETQLRESFDETL